MNKLLLFCSVFCYLVSAAQTKQQKIDSLRTKFREDSAHIFRFKKLRPWMALDQRNSWIRNEKGIGNIPISINGLQAGVIIQEKHTAGFGLYSITNRSQKPVKITDQNSRIAYEELFMNYATLYYQYVIIDTRYFELDLPLEVGLGRYNYNLKDETQTALLWKEEGPVKLTGGGANIIIKPLRWVGLSGMAGYRIAVFNKRTNLNFNGIYYSYGLWVDLRQIYRDAKFYWFKKPRYKKNLKAISSSEA